MIWNYLSVAWRNLLKNKLHSSINIFGLSIGLATCMMIALYVRDETTFDRFWAKADSLYRIDTYITLPGQETRAVASVPGPFQVDVPPQLPDSIARVARVYENAGAFKVGDKTLSMGVSVVDPDILEMFDLTVISGDMAAALSDANGMALNAESAIRLFGRTDVLGETVDLTVYSAERRFEIRAIYADLPHNTTMRFGPMLRLNDEDFRHQSFLVDSWFSLNNTTFAELKPGVNLADLQARIGSYIDGAVESPFTDQAGNSLPVSRNMRFEFKPLTSLQLGGNVRAQMKPVGSQQRVALFAVIALLILTLACINFINLTTAKATQRAREVALRKVLGAERRQLMLQFFGESMLLSFTALIIALVLLEAGLPLLNASLNRQLMLQLADVDTLLLLMGLLFVVGVLGGVYPALILSGFRPAFVLRANKSADVGGVPLVRQVLVVAQFSVSIVLLIATAVIYGQMLYVSSQNPGYRTDNILLVHNGYRMGGNEAQKQFLAQLAALPGVTAVARGNGHPMQGNENNENYRLPSDVEGKMSLIGVEMTGANMLQLYAPKLLAGRLYNPDLQSDFYPSGQDVSEGRRDGGNVILNSMAAAKMGYAKPADALGQVFLQGVGRDQTGEGIWARFTIVGVVEPMRFQSLKTPLRPMVYKLGDAAMGNLHVAFTGNRTALRQQIEAMWTAKYPDIPFSYNFVDGIMTLEFAQERSMAQLLGAFAGLAILIACLGLFGLASFTAEHRTKEIGIRKVLGARVVDVVRLLVWQFSRPILLANLIAWPVAYLAMSTWLQSFPFRLDTWVIWPISVGVGCVALLIAWGTVGGNAAVVARLNPVISLRRD